jgi:phosphatidylserine/phosphatidylglycerophosphate/cardiolipin synthase-like enzyme
VWRYAKATRAHVVVDAAPYFAAMHEAMQRAQHQILLIGWDFDTRINLIREAESGKAPARLGPFMVWLVNNNRRLKIRVLKWNVGALKFLLRGSMVFDLVRWAKHRRIDFKFDAAHPVGCSHHQKIAVIDDRFAVCGGIDMTSSRWDTPHHKDNDPARVTPLGRASDPWHDATMLLEGEVAAALGELSRWRWKRAGGKPIETPPPCEESAWPEGVDAEFENVEVGIARTRSAHEGCPEVREIEALFLEHIARARKFIYAESQYFASRRIAEAFAKKLAEPDPPEIVIVNPMTADGWLEQTAMDGARVRLLQAIGKHDHKRRLRMFVPHTIGGKPIYVHAKITIIDDEILRIGSANMNNRSLGLDSECDVFIDATRHGNAHAAPAIANLRYRLLAEHCGVDPAKVFDLLQQHGSMARLIAAQGRHGKRLRLFDLPALSDTEKAIADNEFLDPERPEEMFEPMTERGGLFGKSRLLQQPG